MKKGKAAVDAATDTETISDNKSDVLVNKGCASSGWKEEYRNQRCIDLLGWMLGRG